MIILTLKRFSSTDRGTFGVLLDESGYPIADTVERPWKNNENEVSCIPIGEYVCKVRWSETFKRNVYEILNVPNRTDILLHPGNTMMDVKGCILLGFGWQNMINWPALANSRIMFDSFMNKMMGKEFKLVIQ